MLVRRPPSPLRLDRGASTDVPKFVEESRHPWRSPSPLDGELLDLYAAFVIVVPLALLVKSLWI